MESRNEIIKEFAGAINRNSLENVSNTPDYILAQFLESALAAFNTAVQQRETSYGRDARPTAITAAPAQIPQDEAPRAAEAGETDKTPRTDAAADHFFHNSGATSGSMIEHARTLERELTAARREVERLTFDLKIAEGAVAKLADRLKGAEAGVPEYPKTFTSFGMGPIAHGDQIVLKADYDTLRAHCIALAAKCVEASLIDKLEVYMVDGEPRFALRDYPGGPRYFESARAAIDAALSPSAKEGG